MAYNRHFTQYINKSYINQSTHIGSTTEPKEKKTTPNARSPIVPNWAPLLIIRKRNIVTTKFFIELPLELGCVICTGIIGTCNCLEVSVSHGDSAISHPRDQDYLSLRVGKSSEVELQQALAYMEANLPK